MVPKSCDGLGLIAALLGDHLHRLTVSMSAQQEDEGNGAEEKGTKRRRKRRRDRSLELDDEDFDLLEEQGIKVGTAAHLRPLLSRMKSALA
jgi:hypothetical protein